MAASLAGIIRQVSRPHTAVLGRLPGPSVFRNVDRFPDAQTADGLVVMRFDTPLYYANVEFFRDRLRRLEAKTTDGLRAVVLDASAINEP
ncbi:MAG: STAS domain-containing protein [Actinomycetota bacterium]